MRADQIGGRLHGRKEALGLGKVITGSNDIPVGNSQFTPLEVQMSKMAILVSVCLIEWCCINDFEDPLY